MEVRRDPSLEGSPKVSQVFQKRKGRESLLAGSHTTANAKSNSLLDAVNFTARQRELGKVHSTIELAPGSVYMSKEQSAAHAGSGRIRNVPIKSSKHTIKMLNPVHDGQLKASPSYKPRSPSRSPKHRSSSPGSSGSLDRKKAPLGGLPSTRLQKARKSAGSSRPGVRRLSGRHSARANAKYDNYQGAQYGRPGALRNSSSAANLGNSITP